jgi:hypothetical protein
MVFLARRKSTLRPEILWLLGIAALLPAWLIAFLGLIGLSTSPGTGKASSLLWILSSAAAVLGVIFTDAALRRLREMGRAQRPSIPWFLGVVALLPGWGIALFGLLVRTPGK